MFEEEEYHQDIIEMLHIFFLGNKYRPPKMKIDFALYNNDVLNNEQEKEVGRHFVKWFKHRNNYPDSDNEEFLAAFFK